MCIRDRVSTSWNTLQYRVKAVDTAGNSSAYTTSGAIAVIHNQPPVISGQNADLGVKREDFAYEYSVTDPDNDVVNLSLIHISPVRSSNRIRNGFSVISLKITASIRSTRAVSAVIIFCLLYTSRCV